MEDARIIPDNKEVSSLDNMLSPVKQIIEPLDKGQNVLIQFGDTVSLLKYEGAEIGSTDPLNVRANRHTNIMCIGNLLMPRDNDPYTHRDSSKRITEKARVEILRTHRIDFDFDKEFGIYLPSAENHTDLYLTLANKFGDGHIEKTVDGVTIIADEGLLVEKLKEISRPQYFEKNIIPFIENRNTDLEMPKWGTKGNIVTGLINRFRGNGDLRKPSYGKFNMWVANDWLTRATKDLEHGDFVYVGSKEEVYLLSVAKNDDGSLYMQGTYTTSTKPMLHFSNNYLGHMSKFDMQRPMFKGSGSCNVAEYRTSDAPGFNGVPFVFSSIGRKQNCKNSIFTGEPDIITGNLEEALGHFETTDFKEFGDIVKAYSHKAHEPTPNSKPNGRFFY